MIFRKLRVLYERHSRYLFNQKTEKDTSGTPTPSTHKEKNSENMDSDVESNDDFEHEPETQHTPDEVNQHSILCTGAPVRR